MNQSNAASSNDRPIESRFSLRSFLLTSIGVAIVVAMVLMEGVIGIAFSLIHLSFAAAMRVSMRRNAYAAVALATTYLTLWIVTALTSHTLQSELAGKMGATLAAASPNRAVNRFDFDPVELNRPEQLDDPWFYVGGPAVPCPLVVACDHAVKTEGPGVAHRSYWLSVFGFRCLIYEDPKWIWC